MITICVLIISNIIALMMLTRKCTIEDNMDKIEAEKEFYKDLAKEKSTEKIRT